ncbi:unnamed protein product [Calicophoron daubneyi]|uniref:EGF-like domain-containing protein n=1 Tax=Calicophoron daubneyi TaxID=300641 RepID=A0AAV2T084_CALDB
MRMQLIVQCLAMQVVLSWDVNIFKKNEYQFGYPLDFIGNKVPTKKVTYSNPAEFRKLAGVTHVVWLAGLFCHHPLSEYTKMRHASCNAPKDTDVRIPVIYGNNEIRWDNLENYFKLCKSKTVLNMQMCGFSDFVKLLPKVGNFSNRLYYPGDTEDYLALYSYHFCRKALPAWRRESLDSRTHALCPNPCSVKVQTCSKTPNTMSFNRTSPTLNLVSEINCLPIDQGFYKEDYACICSPGYVWDSGTKRCWPMNFCAEYGKNQPSLGITCYPFGTKRCVNMPATGLTGEFQSEDWPLRIGHTCICREGHMGARCSERRNACLEVDGYKRVPGNQACRTYLGNLCIPENGTNVYLCKCSNQWEYDRKLAFPNCYKRKHVCDSVVCHHSGRCVGSADERSFICLCEYGWDGKYCETPDVRYWLPWCSWTTCSGLLNGGMGWRSRTRRCRVHLKDTEDLGHCKGNTVEFQPCKFGSIYGIKPYVNIMKIVLLFAACLALLQLLVGMIFAVLNLGLM